MPLLLKVIGVALASPTRISHLLSPISADNKADILVSSGYINNLLLEEAMVRSAGTESR